MKFKKLIEAFNYTTSIEKAKEKWYKDFNAIKFSDFEVRWDPEKDNIESVMKALYDADQYDEDWDDHGPPFWEIDMPLPWNDNILFTINPYENGNISVSVSGFKGRDGVRSGVAVSDIFLGTGRFIKGSFTNKDLEEMMDEVLEKIIDRDLLHPASKDDN